MINTLTRFFFSFSVCACVFIVSKRESDAFGGVLLNEDGKRQCCGLHERRVDVHQVEGRCGYMVANGYFDASFVFIVRC